MRIISSVVFLIALASCQGTSSNDKKVKELEQKLDALEKKNLDTLPNERKYESSRSTL